MSDWCSVRHLTRIERAGLDAVLPLPYRVIGRRAETADTVTLRLAPIGAAIGAFRPGQFTMLDLVGIGEIAVSISGDPAVTDCTVTQTLREVGAVSSALAQA